MTVRTSNRARDMQEHRDDIVAGRKSTVRLTYAEACEVRRRVALEKFSTDRKSRKVISGQHDDHLQPSSLLPSLQSKLDTPLPARAAEDDKENQHPIDQDGFIKVKGRRFTRIVRQPDPLSDQLPSSDGNPKMGKRGRKSNAYLACLAESVSDMIDTGASSKKKKSKKKKKRQQQLNTSSSEPVVIAVSSDSTISMNDKSGKMDISSIARSDSLFGNLASLDNDALSNKHWSGQGKDDTVPAAVLDMASRLDDEYEALYDGHWDDMVAPSRGASGADAVDDASPACLGSTTVPSDGVIEGAHPCTVISSDTASDHFEVADPGRFNTTIDDDQEEAANLVPAKPARQVKILKGKSFIVLSDSADEEEDDDSDDAPIVTSRSTKATRKAGPSRIMTSPSTIGSVTSKASVNAMGASTSQAERSIKESLKQAPQPALRKAAGDKKKAILTKQNGTLDAWLGIGSQRQLAGRSDSSNGGSKGHEEAFVKPSRKRSLQDKRTRVNDESEEDDWVDEADSSDRDAHPRPYDAADESEEVSPNGLDWIVNRDDLLERIMLEERSHPVVKDITMATELLRDAGLLEDKDAAQIGRSTRRRELPGNRFEHLLYTHPAPQGSGPTDGRELLERSINFVLAQVAVSELPTKARVRDTIRSDREGLGGYLWDRCSPAGKYLLNAVAKGQVSEEIKKGVLSQLVKDVGRYYGGGIYAALGFNKEGRCIWIYIGRTVDFIKRFGDHDGKSRSLPRDPYKTKNLHYHLAKRTYQEGGSIEYIPLMHIDGTTAAGMDLQAVAEPVMCGAAFSYQCDEDYVGERAIAGLPILDIKGANSTSCYEPYEEDSTGHTQSPNLPLRPLLSRLASLRIQSSIAQGLRLLEEVGSRAFEEAQQVEVELKGSIYECRKRYWSKFAELVLNGDFILRLAFVHGVVWECTNYFRMSMREETILNAGVSPVDFERAKESGEPLYLALKVNDTDTPSSHDFFTLLRREQTVLLGGVQLLVGPVGGTCTVPWHNRGAVKEGTTRLRVFSFIKDIIPSKERRRLEAESIAGEMDLPDDVPDFVKDLLNGKIRISKFADSAGGAFYIPMSYTGVHHSEGLRCFTPPCPLMDRAFKENDKSLWLRVSFTTKEKAWRFRGDSSAKFKELSAVAGLEYSPDAISWYPISRPYQTDRCRKEWIEAVYDALQAWKRIDGNEERMLVAGDDDDDDEEPIEREDDGPFFRIKTRPMTGVLHGKASSVEPSKASRKTEAEQHKKAKAKEDPFKVSFNIKVDKRLGKSGWYTIQVPMIITSRWYPGGGYRKGDDLSFKIDGTDTTKREDVEMWFRKNTPGPYQGKWFRRSKFMSKSSEKIAPGLWNLIQKYNVKYKKRSGRRQRQQELDSDPL